MTHASSHDDHDITLGAAKEQHRSWLIKEIFIKLMELHDELKKGAASAADSARSLSAERDRLRRTLLLVAVRKEAALLLDNLTRYRLLAGEMLVLVSELPEPELTCPDDIQAYQGQQCQELLQRWLAKTVSVYVQVRRREAELLAAELIRAIERLSGYLAFMEQTLIEDCLGWIE